MLKSMCADVSFMSVCMYYTRAKFLTGCLLIRVKCHKYSVQISKLDFNMKLLALVISFHVNLRHSQFPGAVHLQTGI